MLTASSWVGNNADWTHWNRWWADTSKEQRTRFWSLGAGVTVFSLAMYINALSSTQGIAITWVVAAGAAVFVGVAQTNRAFQDSLRVGNLAAATDLFCAIWLGLYAFVLCLVMVAIVALGRIKFTVVDEAILGVNLLGGVLSVILFGASYRATAKLVLFLSLKVLPQCGQAFLLVAVGTANPEWYVVFLAGSLFVGVLRVQFATQAYRQNKLQGKVLSESRANYWSWWADVLSFVLMAACFVVAIQTGGMFPDIQGTLFGLDS